MADFRTCGDDGGWSRQRHMPCGQRPLKGRTRCKFHGGRVPTGQGNGAFRHGRYSRELPIRLQPVYAKAITDPTILALIDEIGVLNARLVDLFRKVDTGESSHLWRLLHESWQTFTTARSQGDTPAMAAALQAHEQTLNRGMADTAAWRDIQLTIEQIRKLVETEHKQRVARRQLMAVERVLLLLTQVEDIVMRHIREQLDADTLKVVGRRIGQELRALVQPGATP